VARRSRRCAGIIVTIHSSEELDTATSGRETQHSRIPVLGRVRVRFDSRADPGWPGRGSRPGRLGWRPKKLAEAKQLALARTLYVGGHTDITTISQALGISRATLYRALKAPALD
jgi:hypothetical protein